MAKAIRFHETGGPEVLRLETVEVGEPGPGQARVRHSYIAVNFIDTYFRTGRYPLARYLYVYVNKAPNRPLNPLEGEFLRLILSRSGQEAVVKDGYIPLPAAVVQQALKTLGY